MQQQCSPANCRSVSVMLTGRHPMRCTGTTGTLTLNKLVRRASVSVVPEGTISNSPAFAKNLRKNKKLPYPAPLIRMAPDTVFDFSGRPLLSLVFSDFSARRLAELHRCLLLGQDDAPAKRHLDQPGEIAIEPLGLQRLEFFAALRRGDPAVLIGI